MMIATRRGVLVGAAAVLAVPAALGRRMGPAETLSGLVPGDADMLVLAPVGYDRAALIQRFGLRRGRTVIRPVAPLAHFGDLAALIYRASGVHVVAVADAAGLLVIDTLLQRAGAAPVRKATAIGDVSLARL